VWDNYPSPVFEERIRHGVALYHAGFASKILFTGGYGAGKKHSESQVGTVFAEQLGIPCADILSEEESHTTKQNLSHAMILMQQHGLKTAIIVSDPLHMKRTMMIANHLGMDAFSSPTPTSRYRSLHSKLKFMARELYFVHHFMVTGD
jgi:uncharacterized SAM-binding protein YcdF (DUF218 family)